MHRDSVVIGTQNGALDVDWIIKEIQLMLHGMGDCAKPLLSTAQLFQEILLRQLRSAVQQAAEVCALRGADLVTPQDFIFLMRRNKSKVARALKFIRLRELRLERSGGGGSALLRAGRMRATAPDEAQRRRQLRADALSRALDPARYLHYVRARHASFCVPADKLPRLLEATLGHLKAEAPRLSAQATEMLGYVAYETVAQLVDLTFAVRQDGTARTAGGAGRSGGPLTPGEVAEAVRRYFSARLGVQRARVQTRLLAC